MTSKPLQNPSLSKSSGIVNPKFGGCRLSYSVHFLVTALHLNPDTPVGIFASGLYTHFFE